MPKKLENYQSAMAATYIALTKQAHRYVGRLGGQSARREGVGPPVFLQKLGRTKAGRLYFMQKVGPTHLAPSIYGPARHLRQLVSRSLRLSN